MGLRRMKFPNSWVCARNRRRFRCDPGNRGIALLLVLWVIVFLSVIVSEFCFATRSEINVTRNRKEKIKASYIAYAGLQRGIDEILRRRHTPFEMEEDSESVWRVNVDIPKVAYKSGYYKVWIDNQSGKIDINIVDKPTLLAILEGFNVDETERNIITDSILDWRDNDSLHRLNGAEDEYYKSLPKPYSCKNADFESIDELLFVRGMSRELYDAGIGSIFTVNTSDGKFSRGENKGKKQKLLGMRINVNAASRKTLLALPGMNEEIVEKIITYRKTKDFISLSELIPLMGIGSYVKCASYLQLNLSRFYLIHSVGSIEGSKAEHYLKAMVEFDPLNGKKYRIVKYWDQA